MIEPSRPARIFSPLDAMDRCLEGFFPRGWMRPFADCGQPVTPHQRGFCVHGMLSVAENETTLGELVQRLFAVVSGSY